jgi:diadenosine tetraphosphate (Ap4A) HIT family hydrolase
VSTTSPCPFCERAAAGGAEFHNDHALGLPDAFPVSPGHTLVIPRRHCEGLFDLTAEEYAALWWLAREVREALRERLQPDGFNVGANDGAAAGQTVAHAHVHVIPRFGGDVPDPRGGIRWVVPGRAAYWEEADA